MGIPPYTNETVHAGTNHPEASEAGPTERPTGISISPAITTGATTFSQKLKLRAGKVKQPFGISAEVFDVGTRRPFFELPQAVYGPIGLVGESYKGIGFTGSFDVQGGWGLAYDLYGGGQEHKEYVAPEAGRLTSDVLAVPEPAVPSLLDHKEVALGLNYWWTPNFVFKLSFHHVDGNRFAGPDPLELAQAAFRVR